MGGVEGGGVVIAIKSPTGVMKLLSPTSEEFGVLDSKSQASGLELLELSMVEAMVVKDHDKIRRKYRSLEKKSV